MSIQRNIQKSFLMGSTALTRPAATLGAMAAMVLGSGSAFAIDANTLPSGGTVTGGAATISQNGTRLDVNQSTNRTVLDWRSFDIGENAHVNFNQPNSGSIAVNRINQSTNPTQINGQLTANGHVWVLNPNGVMFGASARVDVSGLVASTANINVDRFMAGDTRLDLLGAGGGSVVNEGQITVREGGLAAFVAPHVRNNGTIRAKVGKVAMAAGETFTLDLAGDRLIEIGLGAEGAKAEQLGQVVAEGGVIEISAKAATEVVDSIVNVDGITSAASATVAGGEIILGGGEVTVAGTLDASGATGGGSISIDGENITTESTAVLKADATDNGDGGSIIAYAEGHGEYAGSFSAKGGDGGFVETSGETVSLDAGLRVATSAANGDAGTWLIDPVDLVVGAGEAAAIVTNLNSGNVDVEAENSITVNSAIDSSAQSNSNQLALKDENTDNDLIINLNAAITLGANQTLTGEGTVVNVSNAATIQSGVDVASAAGAQVNVADGTYVENVRISKSNLTLVSENGRDATTIQGISGVGALGAVQIDSGANNFTFGGTGNGFTVIGIDNGAAGIENAAVYFQGANSGSTVQGNRITANGDAGLMSEYNAAVVGLTVDGNIFDGQAFTGPNPAGDGFSQQFTLANVPRQLVVISGGSGVTNTQNITFTNNQVTGTAGGLNGSGDEQGNTLVTIDAVGATITGNTFAGTTSRYGNQLRARGSNTVITDNTFDNANLTASTSPLYVRDTIFSGNAANIDTFAELMAANTWQNGAAWTDNAVGGYYAVVKSVQGAIDMALSGGVVNLFDGTYTQTDTLDISKSVTLSGESEAGTIIDSSGIGNKYAIQVEGDNVNLNTFTLIGTSTVGSAGYGIKVQPDTGTVSDRVLGLSISDVTVQDSYRTALDLHAVDGATIDNFTALNTVWGNGITLTDSANVTITNSTTTGNVWGGLALYQRNAYYDLKSDNISIDATNTFNEDNPVYAQQYTAASQQFGDDITIEGFSHAVTNPNTDGGTTVYSWFQRTLSDAIDFALAVTNPGSSAVEGWDGSGGDGQFYVGTASGGGAMSVQAASDAASDGDTINILAGTYAGGTTLNNQGLTIQGQTGAIIDVANGQNGFDVRADNITLTGLEIVGPVVGDWRTVDWNDASVSYSIGINISHSRSGIVITNNNIHDIRSGINVANNSDASITNNRIENTKGGVLVRPASITALSGNTEGPLGNEWGVVLNLQNIDDASTADAARQAFLLDLSEANDDMAVFDRGYGFKNRTHIYVDDDTPIATAADDFGYGNGLGNERQELPSIQAAFNSVVAGGYVQVAEGTYAGNATTNDLVNILGQNATVEGLTLNGAGSMIGGSFSSAVSGFTFGAPIILGDNLTLTTTGPATITAGAIDADTAGVQTLTVNAGGTASFGSLGGTTRLGATSITAAGTTLTGADYNANSLTFGGPVTLTQALTSFNSTISGTQAGNITFTGNIFGTANGAQSLNLIAGNGAGAKSSNGDVSIQNAGTEAVQLGGLTVNADDFSAATVWLAGDYNGTMTGNQTFTDETLNTGGNVSSTVGGNVSGPINSGGNVNVNSGGNVSGNVSGNNVTLAGQNVNSNVTANQTANITAQNSVSGSVSAGSGGTINAGTVNTNLSGGSFTVNASGGSVTGNPSGLNTSGSGSLKVNGQTVVGSSDADFNQIVVEGFALPAGATVTDTGEIVLPQGLAIGLISPAAGEGSEGTAPRVIFVRSVQRLGALLAEGYSAIVIDLNEGVSEEEQEMAMAQ